MAWFRSMPAPASRRAVDDLFGAAGDALRTL
jgi:hypothetical protein